MSDCHKHCLVLSVLFHCTGVYHILNVVHNGTTPIVTNTALYCLIFSHCNSIYCKGLVITTEICCNFLFVMWSAHLTYIHPLNGPLSGTTQVSRYQKGKSSLDFTGARDSGWQWHQLGHVQVCTSLQTDNHTSTPPLSFFTGRMPFLPPNQQRRSTEGILYF